MSDPREPETSSVQSPSKRTLSPNKFEHEAVIGRTPTTVVHRVSVDGPPGRIAVKHPARHGTMPGDVFESFRNEAKRWAQLAAHEHVVGVLDWAESSLPWIHHDADVPWIAMEYMDGGDLSNHAGELPVETALWTAGQLADAVWYAHHDGGGVIHHDLKPENVLFRSTPEDQYDVPKIADWELARTLLDHTNSVGVTTPLYVAPEQAYNDPTDQRTDQFQLGIVLYELFTGVHPFVENPETAPEAAVINGIIDNDPTPPTNVNPALPAELDDILGRMLTKDPNDRYEAMLQVREKLDQVRCREINGNKPSDESTSEGSTTEAVDSGIISPKPDSTSGTSTKVSPGKSRETTTETDENRENSGVGIIQAMNSSGRGKIATHLADDGYFALSELDSDLSKGDVVVLNYEGTNPSATDITSVRLATGRSKPDHRMGIIESISRSGRATIATSLVSGGSFTKNSVESNLSEDDPVVFEYEGTAPTPANIESIQPMFPESESRAITDYLRSIIR
jgi:serine/threonine protein kinase